MKRFILVLTSLTMIFAFLLSACQPVNEQNENEQTEAETSEETEAEVEEDVEENQESSETESTSTEEISEDGPAVGGTFKMGISFEIDTLDPQETWSGLPHKYIFGSILYYDADQETYYPYLGESVDISEDGLTYTVKLKEGVTFHDGSPLTAEDFVYTIERASVSGAAFSNLSNFESIEALDEYTVEIKFSAPNSDFMSGLTSWALAPLPKDYIESVGDEEFTNNPVGAGPFMFESYQTGEKLTLKRNPDFTWGPSFTHMGPAYIETVEFVTIPEYATLVAGLEAEELDLILLENQDVERLSQLDYIDAYQFSERGSGIYVALNVETAPFDNLALRQAFNHVLDRDSMLKIVSNGYGIPIYGPVDPGTTGAIENIEDIAYFTDLEEADRLMQEAGYSKNNDGFYAKDGSELEVTLINHFPKFGTAAEVIQEQFNQFGIKMNIQTLEFSVSMDTVQRGEFEMVIWGWAFNNCSFLYPGFHSSNIGNGGLNLGRINNPELDGLLDQAITTPLFEDAIPYYQDAQKIIIENAYILPMFNLAYFQGCNTRVKDIKISSTIYEFSLFDAYIETSVD